MFSLAVTALVGVTVGMVPALQVARCDPQQELRYGPRTIGRGHRRLRGALVVGEVALALVLLVGSGLLFRSLQRVFAVPTGFDPSHVLTMQLQPGASRTIDRNATHHYYEQVLGAVRQVPGVESASITSQLPLSGDHDEFGVHFEAYTNAGSSCFRYAVSPDYLRTMRIPLRTGRPFEDRDDAGAPLVSLISESLARRRFPTGSPIGQRLRIGPTDGPLYTVVGVVGDLKQVSLVAGDADAVYTTAPQWLFPERTMSLVVRATHNAPALAAAVRQAVWSVDKDQPIARVATMEDMVAAKSAERRFTLILFQLFAFAALTLAAAGIYGVLATSVAERSREIGVRSVLGATRGMIVSLVLRQALTLVAPGVVIGLVGAAILSRSLVALLFRVSPLDPLTYLEMALVLGAVAVVACSVPAWRAARLDPLTTLKAE
jgi:putative ABC transport system permease protein